MPLHFNTYDGAVGNFQWRAVLLNWMIVRQGPTVFAVGASEGCLDIFLWPISVFFLPLDGRWPYIANNTVSKGRSTHKQPTNHLVSQFPAGTSSFLSELTLYRRETKLYMAELIPKKE